MKIKLFVFLFIFLNMLTLHVYFFYNYYTSNQYAEAKSKTISKMIQENKFYHITTRNIGSEGKCTIMLKILNNETIKDIKVVQKLNFNLFNKSALKTINLLDILKEKNLQNISLLVKK